MSLAERGFDEPSVSLGRLLEGGGPDVSGQTDAALADYAREITAGGFPGLAGVEGDALSAALDGYLHRAVDHDVAQMGHRVRRPATMRRWLTAYAAATAGTASYERILDAATAGESDKPAKSTTSAYRDLLEAMWLLEPLQAWQPTNSPLSRLKRGPKHHLADPCLAARLLELPRRCPARGRGVAAGPRGRDGAQRAAGCPVRVLGVAQRARLRPGLGSSGRPPAHMERRSGSRSDRRAGQQGACRGGQARSRARSPRHRAPAMGWQDRLGTRCADCVLVTTGPYAYRDQDGIAVVPAAPARPMTGRAADTGPVADSGWHRIAGEEARILTAREAAPLGSEVSADTALASCWGAVPPNCARRCGGDEVPSCSG